MKGGKGFLLIEALLAIGIIGGAVLCLLGLFTPIFSKVKDVEFIEEFEDIEGKISTYIEMGSFEEIYSATRGEEEFYFYSAPNVGQTVSKTMKEIEPGERVIRAKLFPSQMTPIASCRLEDYEESYFVIDVEINEHGKRNARNYIVIKSR